MDDIRDIVADNLRLFRILRGLSQEELGHLCGLDRTYIGGIEQKRKNACLKNLGIIADALDIDYALLFIPLPDEIREHMPVLKRKSRKPIESGTFYALYSWDNGQVHVDRLAARPEYELPPGDEEAEESEDRR